MDIDNIKCVLKVAECLSINRASLFLYKTQPQVSRIIRSVEGLVNTEIFERTPKGLKITPKGQEILAYCRQITDLYDEMVRHNMSPQNSPEYKGKIHFFNSVNIYSTVSDILGSFTTRYPQIAINSITCHPTDTMASLLATNNALGLLAQIYLPDKSPYHAIPDELEFTELLTLPVIALCAVNAPYATKYKTLSAKTLPSLPLIEFNPYGGSRQSFTATVIEAMQAEACEFQYTTDDLRILQNFLEKGSGLYVGIYPSPSLVSDKITGIPLREKVTIGFGVLRRRDNLDPLAALLCNYLIEWYQKIY